MNKEEEGVYRKAISKWGRGAQIDVAIEEMAELIHALCKSRRRIRPKGWLYNIYEEIADVEIILEQMKIIFGGENMTIIYKLQKLERLAQLLDLDPKNGDQTNTRKKSSFYATVSFCERCGREEYLYLCNGQALCLECRERVECDEK